MLSKTEMSVIKMQDIINQKEFEKILKKQPIYNTIFTILNYKEDYDEFLKNNFKYEETEGKHNCKIEMSFPEGIEITENAMAPIIERGDKVTIEIKKDYESSDILLIEYKENIIARYMFKVNNTVRLVAINKKYKELIDDKDEIKILGRINNIIKKI